MGKHNELRLGLNTINRFEDPQVLAWNDFLSLKVAHHKRALANMHNE
jgi:hypothetical protein